MSSLQPHPQIERLCSEHGRRLGDQGDLDADQYGTSIVSARYVFHQIAALEFAQVVDFVEGFWWGHQDLYVVRRRAGNA
jgi:hypothetical protein